MNRCQFRVLTCLLLVFQICFTANAQKPILVDSLQPEPFPYLWNTVEYSKTKHMQRKVFEENGKVLLSIADNGPGADEKQIDALYNKEAAVNSKNGLGLHLIRDLAHAIHCAISFSSKPGAGTTFRLSLH